MHDLFASLPIPQFFNLPFHDFSMYQIRKVPETGKSRALRFLRNCLWWMTRLGCDCLWLSAWVKCCIFQLSTWIRPLSVWAFTASTQLCRRNPLSHGLRRRRHSAAMEGNELEVPLKVHNLCEAALLARRPSRTSYESRRPPPSRDLPKVLVDEDSTNLKVWNHGLSVFHKCRLSLTAKMVGSWQAAWPVHARRPAQTQQNPKSALWILWAFGAWLRLGFECISEATSKSLASFADVPEQQWNSLQVTDLLKSELGIGCDMMIWVDLSKRFDTLRTKGQMQSQLHWKSPGRCTECSRTELKHSQMIWNAFVGAVGDEASSAGDRQGGLVVITNRLVLQSSS